MYEMHLVVCNSELQIHSASFGIILNFFGLMMLWLTRMKYTWHSAGWCSIRREHVLCSFDVYLLVQLDENIFYVVLMYIYWLCVPSKNG